MHKVLPYHLVMLVQEKKCGLGNWPSNHDHRCDWNVKNQTKQTDKVELFETCHSGQERERLCYNVPKH